MTHFIARLIQISFMVLFLICLTKKSNILQKYNNVCLSFSWQQLCPEWCLFPQENFWTKNFSSPVGWSPVAKWQKSIKIRDPRGFISYKQIEPKLFVQRYWIQANHYSDSRRFQEFLAMTCLYLMSLNKQFCFKLFMWNGTAGDLYTFLILL